MKAAVLYEYGQPLALEEVELDPPQAGEVRVRIAAAGICRSDLHFMRGEARINLPAVLGHEGSAVVVEVGPGVTSLKPGQPVSLPFVPNCGHCYFCTIGRTNLCDQHAATSGTLFDGTTRLHSGSQRITHMGPSGMGQTTKLVNQVLVVGNMNAVAEAMVFAAASGADLEATIEAVKGGAAGSWQLQNLGPRLIKGDFAPGFMVRLQQKDLRLILEAAREMHLSLPATGLIHQLFASLEASGEGDEGTQALVKVHERITGVKARVNG